jgi:hypothetical protein
MRRQGSPLLLAAAANIFLLRGEALYLPRMACAPIQADEAHHQDIIIKRV